MKARLAEFGAASGVQDGVVARDYRRVFAGWMQNVIARERGSRSPNPAGIFGLLRPVGWTGPPVVTMVRRSVSRVCVR